MKLAAAAPALIAVTALALLTGCGSTDAPAQPNAVPGLSASTVTTPNGRHVECVTMFQQGVSCDWGHAK
jgi:hypothetical protein